MWDVNAYVSIVLGVGGCVLVLLKIALVVIQIKRERRKK
jgi:hypothetical protein